MPKPALRIGIVSTRLAGTDGVSLESAKWTNVLRELGHKLFYFAGESNRPKERSLVVPEPIGCSWTLVARSPGAWRPAARHELRLAEIPCRWNPGTPINPSRLL